MVGLTGKITRAKRGDRRTVYLSNKMAVWTEGRYLFITIPRQKGKIALTGDDGLAYEVMLMLYHHGLALNP